MLTKRRYQSIKWLALIAGLGLTFITTYMLHKGYVADTRHEFEQAAHDRVMAIKRNIEASILAGQSTAGFFLASDVVTRDEFSSYASVLLNEIPFIHAIEWVPKVVDEERRFYENEAAKVFPNYQFTERNEEGQVVPAGQREEYFPVYYLEPYKGNEKAIGFDLASDPIRQEALNFAQNNNLPSSTGRINLVQDTSGHWGFLMYTPVYKPDGLIETVKQHRKNLKGFVVTVFDIPTLIESSLNYLHSAGIDFTIYDDSTKAKHRVLYHHQSDTRPTVTPSTPNPNRQTLSLNDTIEVNNRQWTVSLLPAAGHYQTDVRGIDVGVLFTGSFITLLLIANLRLMRQRELNLQKDNENLEALVLQRTKDLERKNQELESYSYSIAHDLRTPLRSIVGFSQILLEDSADKLNQENKESLTRIINAGKNMAQLIDDILELSRMMKIKLEKQDINMSDIAYRVIEQLTGAEDHRSIVEWHIQENITATADSQLITILLSNLFSNSYKFTTKSLNPKIEFGKLLKDGKQCYFVRDNGVGFDMQYTGKIFGVFQRLHNKDEYQGTGIGLATVQRVVERHNGQVWAESEENEGATFYFTLASQRTDHLQ